MYQEKVKTYYDYTIPFYRFFWHGDTRAIHYGIWDGSTRTIQDALLNTNQVLADKAGIKAGERVLDAGCGVGGSSFWLARQYGASVAGVTLSRKQLRKARSLAVRYGLSGQVEFFLEDYTATPFPDDSFGLVWAIESVCHASDKGAFLREAYRLLKPGGRVVLSDFFVEREPQGQAEEGRLRDFLSGYVIEDLARPSWFAAEMGAAGFRDIGNWDKTQAVLPSAALLDRKSRWGLPLSRLTKALGLTPQLLVNNNRAGVAQYGLFKEGILGYRVFVGKKD